MNKKDKTILLQTLCELLPYKTKCQCFNDTTGVWNKVVMTSVNVEKEMVWFNSLDVPLRVVKPYLRPLSSITDNEIDKWLKTFMEPICELEKYADEEKATKMAPFLYSMSHKKSIDWLKERHFDYYGLIDKGLAIVAPPGMYIY